MPAVVGDGGTTVGDNGTAAGGGVGDEGSGVPVTVDVGEGSTVGDDVGVKVGGLVAVIVGWGESDGNPSGGSPPSRA